MIDNAGNCALCHRPSTERCGDGVCRACHIDCSWEDCITGTWTARVLLRSGFYSREDLQRLYPDANLEHEDRR